MSSTARTTLRGGLVLAAAGVLIASMVAQAAPTDQAADRSSQRPGADFSMTNSSVANSITVFERSTDGTLEETASVPTPWRGLGTSSHDGVEGRAEHRRRRHGRQRRRRRHASETTQQQRRLG